MFNLIWVINNWKILENKELEKGIEVLDRLKEIAFEGFSPSSLTNYLRNPISFYKQKILKIKESNEVEETIAANTLGTVVHETLDKLYTPLVGEILTKEIILKLKKDANTVVKHQFQIFFKNGDLKNGKNRLIFEVANRFVQNFLDLELELVSNPKNQLKILATEKDLHASISIEDFDFPIKIHGKVDRVDELNGEVRIIDYKTGMVKSTELKLPNLEHLREEKHHKAIQVMLYAFLYSKSENYQKEKNLKAGVFSFKNLNSRFLCVDFAQYRKPSDTEITEERLSDFLIEIKEFIKEIYNTEIGFLEPTDAKY